MTALTKRSKKLYDHLSSKQKAALTFKCLANRNEDEAGLITDSVPRHVYRQTEAAYSDWIDVIFSVASLWGLEYWQQMYYSASILVTIAESDTEEYKLVAYTQQQARLAALKEALEEFCIQHGIDVAPVYEFAGVNPKQFKGIEADPDYKAQALANYNNCVPDRLKAVL